MAFEAVIAAGIIFLLGVVAGYYIDRLLNSGGYEEEPEEPEER